MHIYVQEQKIHFIIKSVYINMDAVLKSVFGKESQIS